MTLLQKRDETSMAITGMELLSEKRNVLLREFFGLVRPLMALRRELEDKGSQAIQTLLISKALTGPEALESASIAVSSKRKLEVVEKNIFGVKIPEVRSYEEKPPAPDYGELGTALTIDEMRERFNSLLEIGLKLLGPEVKMRRLGKEIRATTRKVNALQYYVLPQLFSEIRYIEESLEEQERADLFRLKRIKAKLERR